MELELVIWATNRLNCLRGINRAIGSCALGAKTQVAKIENVVLDLRPQT